MLLFPLMSMNASPLLAFTKSLSAAHELETDPVGGSFCFFQPAVSFEPSV
jgi:hypothetical protein